MQPDTVQGQNKRFECRLILLGALTLSRHIDSFRQRLLMELFRQEDLENMTSLAQGIVF